jgi:ankyrin repeat protein
VHLRDAYGGTPGHDAAEYNHYECLKLLLEHGADLYALDQVSMIGNF